MSSPPIIRDVAFPRPGLSENVARLSLSGRHTERLLQESEPVMAGNRLSTSRNYGAVAAIDFAALIEAVTPWVDLALEKGPRKQRRRKLRRRGCTPRRPC